MDLFSYKIKFISNIIKKMKIPFIVSILLSFLVIITVIVLTSYYGSILNKTPKFKLLTEYYLGSLETDILIIECTNYTLGNETEEFTRTTSLSSTCPQTNNPCSEFICNTNGYCDQITKENTTCYQSAQCGNSSRCDLSLCECVSYQQECITDSDCGIDNSNPCTELICVSGSCITNLTAGSECSSSTNCQSGYTCISNCTCQPLPGFEFNTTTYTPVFSAHETYSQPYSLPISYIYAVYTDLGTYARIDIQISTASNNTVTIQTQFGFLFNLPVEADISVNGTGMFISSQAFEATSITRGFYGLGHTILYDSFHGLALATNSNYEYVGPNNSQFNNVGVYFIYKKA